ncbi:MOSC domain-containing protein [Rhizorhabdus argentea]|uniref:MOSC domain-containing protein n=1 Tax=Rhizorhabdus argentea TaxID=1387174 RepID=UPI0030EDF447
MTGRLIGIARKDRPRGEMETLDHVAVGVDTGIAGDFRGAMRAGKINRRQVTIMAAEDWTAALTELGQPVSWEQRRANLLVEGIELPREPGTLLRIGAVLVEITGECDPCRRMDDVADGLLLALMPEWRGGRTARVIEGGDIALGDRVSRFAAIEHINDGTVQWLSGRSTT